MSDPASVSRDDGRSLPILGGLFSGAVAAAVSVIATYVLLFDADDGFGRNVGGVLEQAGAIGDPLNLAYWAVLERQFVDIHSTTDAGTETVTVIAAETTTVPPVGYTLIPVFALVLAGYITAKAYGASTETGALTGAFVTVGYLPAMVGIQTMATVSREQTGAGGAVTVEPSLLQTVLFAGLLFPVLCGVVGGYLYTLQT